MMGGTPRENHSVCGNWSSNLCLLPATANLPLAVSATLIHWLFSFRVNLSTRRLNTNIRQSVFSSSHALLSRSRLVCVYYLITLFDPLSSSTLMARSSQLCLHFLICSLIFLTYNINSSSPISELRFLSQQVDLPASRYLKYFRSLNSFHLLSLSTGLSIICRGWSCCCFVDFYQCIKFLFMKIFHVHPVRCKL